MASPGGGAAAAVAPVAMAPETARAGTAAGDKANPQKKLGKPNLIALDLAERVGGTQNHPSE
ncbi:hypothetical protein GCM10010502_27270 [Kitasatospora aureofaciens]|uniref:Uncharacterized protein n=1 Tax=Kitasatospora aureofaciens TaxID=1894 RepID=A0A8H9LKL8_KITAU|nr:hypothetical protein GCM10010502_27270 [Kitasatospora aureofaciens]